MTVPRQNYAEIHESQQTPGENFVEWNTVLVNIVLVMITGNLARMPSCHHIYSRGLPLYE